MTWQPIETAPKDGSTFLAHYPRQGRFFKAGPFVWGCMWHGSPEKGVWFTGMRNNPFLTPSHWMPFPDHPE